MNLKTSQLDEMARPDGRPQPRAAGMPETREMRRIFGRFATGITVVTAGRETPRGMTANAFTSVSLEPPLVLVCVQRNSTIHETISEAGSFAVSVLAAHQEQEARLFADRNRPRGEREFEAVDTVPGPYSGAPILAGALAWLECELASVYDGGDHSIFLGQVQTLGRGKTEDALLFFDGGFHRLEPEVILPNTA
ncbi:MAG TPA: flavin reductase family protein [Streptosporangiaceae bacterium]